MSSLEAIDCKNLAQGSLIDVETKSRHYKIECLGGNQIRISGHPDFCPRPVPARLGGSFDREGGLEAGLIGPGRRMMFLVNGYLPVTTTRVLHVHVDPPGCAISPKSSPASSPSVN